MRSWVDRSQPTTPHRRCRHASGSSAIEGWWSGTIGPARGWRPGVGKTVALTGLAGCRDVLAAYFCRARDDRLIKPVSDPLLCTWSETLLSVHRLTPEKVDLSFQICNLFPCGLQFLPWN